MKKKNTLLGVALLVAVLMLGIGYAIDAVDLTINGTATAQEGDASFVVKLTDAKVDTTQTDTSKATANVATNGLSATMDVTLTNVGDSQTATFTVTNDSLKGLGAKLTAANVTVTGAAETSNYFTITHDVKDAELASEGGTTTFTVTVTLDKAYVGTAEDAASSVTENFTIVLNGIEAYAE